MFVSISYCLLFTPPNLFSDSGRLLSGLFNDLIFVMSCFSCNTWNTLSIFHFIGSFILYHFLSTTWKIWNNLKNFFWSFFFGFLLMYWLFSHIFSTRTKIWLFTPLLWVVFRNFDAWNGFGQQIFMIFLDSSTHSAVMIRKHIILCDEKYRCTIGVAGLYSHSGPANDYLFFHLCTKISVSAL